MTRGTVVPLTPAEVVTRALYLAGEITSATLDRYMRSPPPMCPTIYYRLADHNGGSDPTAPDPASRWQTEAGTWAVTCDCAGGAAWCAGFDRYQPERFGRHQVHVVESGAAQRDRACPLARERLQGGGVELVVHEGAHRRKPGSERCGLRGEPWLEEHEIVSEPAVG